MGLCESLDEPVQEKFINQVRKAGSEKAGTDVTIFGVIDDSIYNVQATDSIEIFTRTMIKKAYKAIKEDK
jgi:hypothetical protein